MSDTSINDFVKAAKAAFGDVEFKAVNNADGMVVQSKGYHDPTESMVAIDSAEYLGLGQCPPMASPATQRLMFGLMLGKK